jgi:hypothetical protein
MNLEEKHGSHMVWVKGFYDIFRDVEYSERKVKSAILRKNLSKDEQADAMVEADYERQLVKEFGVEKIPKESTEKGKEM